MSNHTPEPWNGKEIRISIPEMERLNVSVAFTGRGIESDANARRIVACVNALAGVPTEWLEKFSVDGSENVAQENARLTKQRDELLEALQRLIGNNCHLTGNPTHDQLVRHWEYEKTKWRGEAGDQLFALYVIAKAKGGAVNHFPDAAKMVTA